jgi:hypothetical protein
MKLIGHALCCVVVFVALLASVSSWAAEWLGEGSVPTDLLQEAVSLLQAQRKGAQLTQVVRAAVVENRSDAKNHIIDDLLAEKLTLFEGARGFRALYESPRAWCDPRRPQPAWDDGESWCRLVIDWAEVKIAFERSQSEGEAVRQRLEDTLEEHLRYHCSVELPD